MHAILQARVLFADDRCGFVGRQLDLLVRKRMTPAGSAPFASSKKTSCASYAGNFNMRRGASSTQPPVTTYVAAPSATPAVVRANRAGAGDCWRASPVASHRTTPQGEDGWRH